MSLHGFVTRLKLFRDMDVKLIDSQKNWDDVLTSFSYSPFTQLWSWGEIQASLGKRVVRLQSKIKQKQIICQWIEERRGPLTYWFAPQGPVVSAEVTEKEIISFVEESKKHLQGGIRICFYRCEPRWRLQEGFKEHIHSLSAPFRRVHSMNPSTSFVVPLQKSSEALFETFHKKTRYNIRLAERHGVNVRIGTDEDWTTFLRLMKETSARNEIRFHSDEYLSTVYQVLKKSGYARLRVAEYEDEPLVVNLEVLCGDTVMYLYGASSSHHRDKMAPFAMQWSAISTACHEGYRWYDFGGGNPLDTNSIDYLGSWEGITRFKEQWGTERLRDSGTFDAPKQPLLYRFLVKR